MEVHHHAQTERKKWTHYFWEFIMLFLAVFCGFLAEYKLEQTIERHREREYILSMIEDLNEDTIKINAHALYRNDRRRRLDSLTLLLRLPDYTNYTGLIYYYARWGVRRNYFNTTDRTIQQLKNAGGMRLIIKPAAAEAIMAYDAQMKIAYTQSYTVEEETIVHYMHMVTAIFDGNVMDEMYADSVVNKPNGNPPLLSNDRRIINELISQLHLVKSASNRNLYFENNLKMKAISTLNILKKEYHMK